MFRLFFKLAALTVKLVTLPFRIVAKLLIGRRRRRSSRLVRMLGGKKKLIGAAALVGAHLVHEQVSAERREGHTA